MNVSTQFNESHASLLCLDSGTSITHARAHQPEAFVTSLLAKVLGALPTLTSQPLIAQGRHGHTSVSPPPCERGANDGYTTPAAIIHQFIMGLTCGIVSWRVSVS